MELGRCTKTIWCIETEERNWRAHNLNRMSNDAGVSGGIGCSESHFISSNCREGMRWVHHIGVESVAEVPVPYCN